MTTELFTEAFWNERYASQAKLWSGNPNPHLVTEAAGLVPGSALDVGCGEGADAIWLAEQGWQVTAVDISTVALDRAREHAGPRQITWRQEDLLTWAPTERYDLISAQYMHLPTHLRVDLVRRLAAAVTSGGALLMVGHHITDLDTTAPRPYDPDLFFTGDDLAALLDPADWQIVTNRTASREMGDVTLHDAVFRAHHR